MKKNKLLSLVPVLALSFLHLPSYAEQLEYPEPVEIAVENEIPANGYIPAIINIDGTLSENEEDNLPMLLSDETLPEAFDAVSNGWVTAPKNQEQFGTCWAFSMISALETSMIKKGYADVNTVDYSELHLSYFAHSKNETLSDGVKKYNNGSSKYGYYGGDNTRTASQYLAGWQGAAYEADFPYPPASKDYTLSESDRYDSVVHLQDYYVIPNNNTIMKKAIMEYGCITAAYYNNYIFSDNNAYYQSDFSASAANHAITIVGWDDNYPVSNFEGLSDKPSAPGAWKIKNSWGTHRGDNGYFWMSYEEPSLCDIMAYNAEKSDNYRTIHQYDGAGTNFYTTNLEKSANIFTATHTQLLQAAGFYTNGSNICYEIDIYKLNDTKTNPEDGTLLASISGTELYSGYHTAELDNPLTINKGESFSVVLSLSNNRHKIEGNTCTSNAGESYIYYDGSWLDSSTCIISYSNSDVIVNNICIKAYSTPENITVSFNTNGGTVLSPMQAIPHEILTLPPMPEKENFYFAGWYKDEELSSAWDFKNDMPDSDITLYAKWADEPILVEEISLSSLQKGILTNETMHIDAEISPYYATNSALSWASSDAAVTIKDNEITASAKGVYTITVTASDRGEISAEYTVNVYDPIGSIGLGLLKSVYKTDEEIGYFISEMNAESFVIYVKTPSGSYISAKVANACTSENPMMGIAFNSYSYAPGKYTYFIKATDPLGNVIYSSNQYFVVSNSLQLAAKKTSAGYIVTGYPEQASEAYGTIIAAYYKDGQLIAAKTAPNGSSLGTSPSFTDIPDDVSVKFMWWDSEAGMSPISDFINITNPNNQITGDVITSNDY